MCLGLGVRAWFLVPAASLQSNVGSALLKFSFTRLHVG